LSETFGASYNGNGTVTHKLSLYRYVSKNVNKDDNINNDIDHKDYRANDISFSNNDINSNGSNSYHKSNDKNKNSSPNAKSQPKSSLVFGAGTVQWSYALSTFHDGPYVQENYYLQQATVNLLADMGVQPGSINGRNGETFNVAEKEKNSSVWFSKEEKSEETTENNINENNNDDNNKLTMALMSTDSDYPSSTITNLITGTIIDLKKKNYVDFKAYPNLNHNGSNDTNGSDNSNGKNDNDSNLDIEYINHKKKRNEEINIIKKHHNYGIEKDVSNHRALTNQNGSNSMNPNSIPNPNPNFNPLGVEVIKESRGGGEVIFIMIRGHSVDMGGGSVAGVEVRVRVRARVWVKDWGRVRDQG
jgi:hypothetical protein